MKLQLKKEFITSSKDKELVARLAGVFFENDHELLKTKKIGKKLANDINEAYYRLISKHFNQYGWEGDLLEMELENLKKDYFCKNNINKSYWLKSYIMEWLTNAPKTMKIDEVFNRLCDRKAARVMYSKIYEIK